MARKNIWTFGKGWGIINLYSHAAARRTIDLAKVNIMKKHLLFLDLDGTLLNDKKEITPGNRAALNAALERGHGVIITTGRPLKSAMAHAKKLQLDKPGCYLVAYNGAVIYDWEKGAQMYNRSLSYEIINRVFDYVNTTGIHVQTYDTWDVLVERRCDNEIVRRYCDGTIGFRVIEDVHTDLTEEPVKILVIDFDNKAALESIQTWVHTNMAEDVECFFSSNAYLEIVPRNIRKGEAVKMLCKLLDVPVANAVAVGDEANDLSMIVEAGIGVAMCNGIPTVKAAANYITHNDNNHDGVAEVVEKFLSDPVTE